jgi:hypothetical protein
MLFLPLQKYGNHKNTAIPIYRDFFTRLSSIKTIRTDMYADKICFSFGLIVTLRVTILYTTQ